MTSFVWIAVCGMRFFSFNEEIRRISRGNTLWIFSVSSYFSHIKTKYTTDIREKRQKTQETRRTENNKQEAGNISAHQKKKIHIFTDETDIKENMEKKVTPTSTKTEILKAYNELLNKIQESKQDNPKTEQEKKLRPDKNR